ncbi:MAG: tRNA (adenosine(37)-N6)-threonylcarbamoyltransferase complex transferase subunit TsaD [Salibacteraceae bacterium]
MSPTVTILGIESSCDETAAAVIRDGKVLANIIAYQKVHEQYGGVVPELASRAHQANIVPVVATALKTAGITKNELNGIAYTRGPGLLGSLLVGTSFTKGLSMGLDIPMLEVNHMQAHILAHFIEREEMGWKAPEFPFLCLTVSGGHTQIVRIDSHFDMEILGQTIDDAAGEAFDKVAKIMGLPYPGGPNIDRMAREGDPHAFNFTEPAVDGFNFSFSGLKTAFLYFLRKEVKADPDFIEKRGPDIAASIQRVIVQILVKKMVYAAKTTGITELSIAGGVSANKELRKTLADEAHSQGWNLYIPPFEYCTDNAAMVGITGYFQFLKGQFATQDLTPSARLQFGKKVT